MNTNEVSFTTTINLIEYGKPIPADVYTNIVALKDAYVQLLNEYIAQINKPLEVAARITSWLDSTDFYSAPASTIYHESFTGGLLVHTLHVYDRTLELLNLPSFASVDRNSAIICALVHDWCKIDLYESYTRNVKDPVTKKWNEEMAFKTNRRGIPLGHGAASMFLISRFIPLKPQEALAIRWHMGEYMVTNQEMSELQQSNESNPLGYLLQFADRLAVTKYANN